MKFSERLLAAIERRGIKKQELASMVGVSNGTISNYLNEDREPDLETIAKLAGALQVSAADLAGFTETDKMLSAIGGSVKMSRAFAENPEEEKDFFNRLLSHAQGLQLSLRDARSAIEKADGEFALLYKAMNDLGVKAKPSSSESSRLKAAVATGAAARKK